MLGAPDQRISALRAPMRNPIEASPPTPASRSPGESSTPVRGRLRLPLSAPAACKPACGRELDPTGEPCRFPRAR